MASQPEPLPGTTPLVGLIMGSTSDWETMQHASDTLTILDIPHEIKIVSAHRTPDRMYQYAETAQGRGIEVIIAGAAGAAHLPGMVAAKSALPVLGVPVELKALRGIDSLLSIAQMPVGIPVGTLAIGKSGAINAALLAAAVLANKYPEIRVALKQFRENQTNAVLNAAEPWATGRGDGEKGRGTREEASGKRQEGTREDEQQLEVWA